MANEFVAKNGLISQNDTTVSGSLTTTGLQVAKAGTTGFAHRTTDYAAGTTGTSLFTGLGAATGNTYGIISVRTSGGSSAAADLILNSNGSGRVAIGTSKTSANATLDVFGNAIITGSLTVTQGITGSLQGTATTASFVTTAQTASYVTASGIVGTVASASNALTASSVVGATPTEVGYLSGVTSAVQTQLDSKVYTLNFFSNAWSIAAGQTYYIANFPRNPATSAGTSRVYIPKSGTITDALFSIYSAGLAGSNNTITVSIRLNNTTDYLIEANSTAAVNRTFTNNSLSIPVVVGDYIEIKMAVATPYTTVPTNNFPTANILIRTT